MKCSFVGNVKRQRRAIPRELVAAVQLCPWKFVLARPAALTTWVVQGSLVLRPPPRRATFGCPSC